jgi:hypothetical protein
VDVAVPPELVVTMTGTMVPQEPDTLADLMKRTWSLEAAAPVRVTVRVCVLLPSAGRLAVAGAIVNVAIVPAGFCV